MRHSVIKRCGLTGVAVLVGLSIAGCGGGQSSQSASTTSSAASSSSPSSSSSSAAASSSAGGKLSTRNIPDRGGAHETIADYIQQAGIQETAVKPGDDGAPSIDLPTPDGWADAGDETPDFAAGAITYTGTDVDTTDYRPNIIALLSKLTGNVDPAKLISLAGGEIQNLPGYEPIGAGEAATVSGFPAYKVAGTYNLDSVKAVTAQETVVIQGSNGIYVLQLNATSNEAQAGILQSAADAIDAGIKITK